LTTHGNTGSIRPTGPFAGQKQLPAGNLSMWMRVCVLEECYPILLAPKVCFPTVVQL
jgi:hypothetical protein